MAEQKKRTSDGLYSALMQISEEEGVDFGLSGMSADDFKNKYFTGPGNIENLYHRLNKISKEEGIDFGQGSRDEWLSSFGYKRNGDGQRGYQTLDGRAVGRRKSPAPAPQPQRKDSVNAENGYIFTEGGLDSAFNQGFPVRAVDGQGKPLSSQPQPKPGNGVATTFGTPYKPDYQLTAAQRDEIHKRNDFAVRQMQQMEQRMREEEQRRNKPIVDTGSEAVNRHVIKTQGQWEDELGQGARRISSSVVVPAVDKAVKAFDKKADEIWGEYNEQSKFVDAASPFSVVTARRANEAKDPDKILDYLKKQMEGVYTDKSFVEEVAREADKMGIDRGEYIEKVVKPQIEADLGAHLGETLMKREMPKSTADYILGGLGNSIVGMLYNAMTETKGQRAYKNQAAAMTEEGHNPYYQPGTGARLTQMGVTFAADAPFFGLYGKVGGQVAKQVAEQQIKRLMAKGLSEGAARSVVGTALENSVGARMKNYLMQHVISGSITMGGFNMTSEAARQVRDSEFSPGQIIGSTAEGLATGAAFGLTGGAVQALSQPLSGIARIGSKVGGYLVEGETMYTTEELAKMVHGEEGFSNPFEGSVEAMMKLGVMKVSSPGGLGRAAGELLHPIRSNRRQQTGIRFTPEEEAYVRNSIEGKNLMDALSQMHPEVATTEIKGKRQLTAEGEQMRQLLAERYDAFMGNTEIPYAVKAKVAGVLGGLMPDAAHTPLETGADIIHNADGSVILKTRDKDGNCMQELSFDTFSEADNWREQHEGDFRLNDAVNMWNGASPEARANIIRQLMDEYGVGEEEAVTMVKSALGGSMGKDFSNDQLLYVYDAVRNNAYPADEPNTRRNYWEGQKLAPQERHQAMVEAQTAEDRLTYMDQDFADEVIGAADYPDDKIAELAGREDITGEQLQAAIDYFNKMSKVNGMMEEAANSVDQQVEAANDFIRRNTHTGSGQLIECEHGGNGYYVTAGNIKLNPDGSIDGAGSGDVIIVRDKITGEIEVVNPRNVMVTAISDPSRMIADNDSMDGLRGRLMKEADDSITLSPDTPTEPQNGDMFTASDGNRYVAMQMDDGQGNASWVKMALNENMEPEGEPQPLDIDEYRKAKSIELDELNMPREEQPLTEEEIPTDNVLGVPDGEIPVTEGPGAIDRRNDESGTGKGDAPVPPATGTNQPPSRIPVDEKGRPQYEQATPEDTMAELTEKYGEEKAQRMVATLAENTARHLEELSQKDTSKMTDMADLAAHEDALAEAQRKADYWGQFIRREEPKAEETVPELTESGQDLTEIVPTELENVPVEPEQPVVSLKEEPQPTQTIPETPIKPQVPEQLQPPAEPQPPVQPQQPTKQEKIYRGSVEANIGRTFTFTNNAGVRSELTIRRIDGDGNAVVARRDYDAQGNPIGEIGEESYAATKVGEAIVGSTWKKVQSTEERLREAYKGRVGILNIIDVLTEPEMEQMLAAHDRGDNDALRELQNEFVERHREDIILRGRDKRNQKVGDILGGGFSIGEKLRRIRKQFQGYDDAELALSDEALQPTTLEEYIADLHNSIPKSGEGPLAYFSYERDGVKVVGMQDETDHGLKSGGDTKGYAPWLAPKGKGMSLAKYAENIHEQLPDGVKEQYSDQDVRNAIIEVFGGAERPSDIPTMIIRRGVIQAEQAARRMEEMWIDGVSYQKKPKSFADRLRRGIEMTSTEPTEAQKAAGNYAKGHVSFGGYDFTIENPAGSLRRGKDADGRQWEQQMHNTYGYILGRYGKDGDHLDMFINDQADLDNWNGRVYVVDQVNKDGSFDEHKVMYGFDSEEEARQAYLSNYEDGWQGLGKITGVGKEKFDEWLDSSKRKMKPFAEHSIGREAAVEDVRERMRQEEQRQREAQMREQVLLDAAIEHLQKHGMEVITDEEGQRVIDRFNGRLTDDVKQMGTTTKKRQESLTASLEGRELSTEQHVVVDAFTDRISNGVLTVKDRKGKTRNITLKQGEDRKAGVKHSLFRHYGTNENFYNADEILFIPDVIANGVRSQAKSKVAYKLEKDGVTYTVTTLLKSNGKEIFTNFYTDREPIAGINGKSNTAMQHLPQQSDSGAKVQQNPDTTNESEEKISFHKVEAGETLDALNNSPTVKRYRAMQLIDGKLYPPMSAKVGKEMREPTEIGVWEQSEERPDLIDPKTGKFKLDKGQKGQGSVPAAYNPYFHTSTSGLNDQFTSSYKRPELVVVEVEIPESELTSGYKAQYAKDAVGDTDWHSGPVNGSLPEDRKRTVTLSRYAKVNRIVPDSEVADMIAAQLEGTNAEVPYNVVTPALRKELEARGVKISAKASGTVTEDINGNPIPKGAKLFKTPDGEAYGFTYQGRMYIDKRIANVETPVHEYGHLWVTMKRTAAPEEWTDMKRVLLGDKLIKPILDKVRDEYPELTTEGKEDDFMEEVLTQFSGRRGAERLREVAEQVARENSGIFGKAEAVTAMQRLKNVLNRFWESVARMLGVKYRNANDIADMMMKDFLNGVDPRKQMKGAQDDAMSQQREIERTLMGVHNVSEEKLRKIIKQGGLANPSLAVIDTKNHIHTDYGEISLIPRSSMIDARTGRNAGTWTADAWTPTYPQVTKRMSSKGQDKYWAETRKSLGDEPGDIRSKTMMAFESWMENGISPERLSYWYLKERGRKPEHVMYEPSMAKEDIEAYHQAMDGHDRFSELDEAGRKAVLALIAKDRGETPDEMAAKMQELKERNTQRMNDENVKAFIKMRAERVIGEIDEYGVPYSYISDYDYKVRNAERTDGKLNVDATLGKAAELVKSEGLEEDFGKWLEEKEKSYGIEEWLYNGTDSEGRQKWVRNTLENASKLMKKQGRNGAHGMATGNLIATVAKRVTTLDQIRKERGNLNTTLEEHEAFKEQWGDALLELCNKCGDELWVGEARLQEALGEKNPVAYLKKEYGVELSKEDQELLNTFIKEVRENYPTGYFETKFERPVGLDEFAVAVVPEDTSADVVKALKDAGLDVRTYDGTEEGRQTVTMDAVKGRDDIMFQKVSHPEPELTPEERQYWTQWDKAMKKWKERNGLPADAQMPTERPKFRQGEQALDYAKRLMQHNRELALWQTAPKMEDYRQVRTDKDAARAARENEERYPASPSAKMRRVAAEALRLRHAMSRQKVYDKATVKAVTDFAQDFMKMGFGDNLGRGEMERLLSSVKNATGAKDIRKQVDNIMNILIDNQLRNLDQQVVKLSSVKELSKTAQGVEKQGRLELKGQRMIQAFRQAREGRMDAEKIRERLGEVAEKMARNDDEAPMWEQEYEGMSIALQYQENIEGSRDEWADLDREYKDAMKEYKQSGRSYKAQQELLESLEQAMMENKIERIGMFGDIIGRLQGNISESMQGAKEFVEREKERMKHIQQIANFDLAGKDMGAMREKIKGKPANFFLQPLATFEQMLRQFGSRNASGEGYLFDHFMRSWMDSTDKAYVNEQKAKEELDAKAREVFGDKVKRWSDLYEIVRSLPTLEVEVLDGEDPKTFTLNQGNLLYIYMADKMTDGRMKLRKMGIDEETVEKVKDFLDPRLVQLGDWLQDDYLVQKRIIYNKVHERMFGAPMAAIDHYFPLKILGDARYQEQDVSNMADQDAVLPSTITGNIIKRRKNALPLDILHTDALSLAIEHVEDMERWAATAEWNKDINTLLSYTTFRNKVKNMSTIYGSGDALWNTFADTARMAAGTYRPKAKPGSVDSAISNIAKGVTAAKINFRVYTAFKQILSAPAFLHDVNIGNFVKNSVNPYGSWKWAMENMPVFEKRWKSRQVGDTRLMDDPTDWKMWKTSLVQMATRMGMSPNALVDGVTCAVGARSIYESRYKKYKSIGASDELAHKRALQDAEIGYNLTQQSSEGAFVSAIQKDRTVAANMLSVFRNSSMAYTRQWVDAARNLKHRSQKGYKEDAIGFMTRQLQEQFGIDEAHAKKAAEAEYARAGRHDVARMLNMMFGVTVAWNLGASLPYLLIGDDDETKSEMMTDALLRGLAAGPTEGFAAGNLFSEFISRSFASEQTRKAFRNEGWGSAIDSALKQGGDYEVNPLPLMADIQGMIKKMGYDKFAAAQDVFNICAQSAVGVNPQTFTDMWNACMDYGAPGWDGTKYSADADNLAHPKEIALFIMRLMNAPTSSWRNKYIDELGMNAEDAQKLSYEEMASRYAHYKHWKDAPIMGWLRGEEGREEKIGKIRKQFDKSVQERIDRLDDEELRHNLLRSKSLEERRLLAKAVASRFGLAAGEDVKNAKEQWQQNYQQLMEYEDIREDALLSAKKKEANARGDHKTVKAINDLQSRIREKGKKKLGGDDDAELMQKIRQWRREALEKAIQAESR